jgi:molybdenum cofactor biosynthesis enzyme MoaA
MHKLTAQGRAKLQRWPLSKLQHVHLEMGMQCNVRCAMCFQTDFHPPRKAADIIWRERLLPVYPQLKTLTITGGEPTIIAGATELLKFIVRDYPHIQLIASTNGIKLEGIWEEAFLQQGKVVNFSLNAITPERYRRVVQFGDYERAVGNLRRLIRRRKDMNSPLKIRISTVVMDDTVPELPDFVHWAGVEGVDQVLILTDCLHGASQHRPELVQQKIAEAYAAAARFPDLQLMDLNDFDWNYARQHGLPPVQPFQPQRQLQRPCPSAYQWLYIQSDGTAKWCCRSWYILGNLIDHDLPTVWNSPAAIRFRERMANMDFRDCALWCDMNCRPTGTAAATFRNALWLVKRDPRSLVKKGLRKFGFTTAQMPDKAEQT